jgi:hypothetical protein
MALAAKSYTPINRPSLAHVSALFNAALRYEMQRQTQ